MSYILLGSAADEPKKLATLPRRRDVGYHGLCDRHGLFHQSNWYSTTFRHLHSYSHSIQYRGCLVLMIVEKES